MFRKILKRILMCACFILLVSCGKKESPQKIVYNGSVMVYSNMDTNTFKKIKENFESTYSGIVLDYFLSDSVSIKSKIEESFELDLPEADIVILDDMNVFSEISNNNWFISYISKEKDNIIDKYKINDKNYGILCSKNDTTYLMGILSNSLNSDNAKLLYDYLLSKNGQEFLANSGFVSVRKDIK